MYFLFQQKQYGYLSEAQLHAGSVHCTFAPRAREVLDTRKSCGQIPPERHIRQRDNNIAQERSLSKEVLYSNEALPQEEGRDQGH